MLSRGRAWVNYNYAQLPKIRDLIPGATKAVDMHNFVFVNHKVFKT